MSKIHSSNWKNRRVNKIYCGKTPLIDVVRHQFLKDMKSTQIRLDEKSIELGNFIQQKIVEYQLLGILQNTNTDNIFFDGLVQLSSLF